MKAVAYLVVALLAAHILHELVLRRLLGLGGPADEDGSLVPDVLGYAVLTWLLLPVWTLGMLGVTLFLGIARALLLARRASRRRWRAERGEGAPGSPLGRLVRAQGAHVLTLGVAVAVAPALLTGADAWAFPWQWLSGAVGIPTEWIGQGLVLLSAYAVAIPGGSVVVEALLRPFSAALPGREELSMGRVIGYLERLILLTLLLIGEYAAMAVIVAAKSLVRIPSLSREGGASEGDEVGEEAWEPGGAVRLWTDDDDEEVSYFTGAPATAEDAPARAEGEGESPEGDVAAAGRTGGAGPAGEEAPGDEATGEDASGDGESGDGEPGGVGGRITTEYFLIGTLGSIAVALAAAMVARWALRFL